MSVGFQMKHCDTLSVCFLPKVVLIVCICWFVKGFGAKLHQAFVEFLGRPVESSRANDEKLLAP